MDLDVMLKWSDEDYIAKPYCIAICIANHTVLLNCSNLNN